MNKQNKWNGPVFGGPKILDDLAWSMGMGTFGFYTYLISWFGAAL